MHPDDACKAYWAKRDKEREQLALDWISDRAVPDRLLHAHYVAHVAEFEHPGSQSTESFAKAMRDSGNKLWDVAMEATK